MSGETARHGVYDAVVTEIGDMLLTDALENNGTLDFTKIVVGKGYLPNDKTIYQMTEMSDAVKAITQITKSRTPGSAYIIVECVFTNEDVTEDFEYREYGIFAKATYPDGTSSDETLFIYGNSGESAEIIPAYGTSVLVPKKITNQIYVGGQTNVSLEMPDGVNATKTELNEAVETLGLKIDEKLPISQKGATGGVAELDDSGKVLSSQLPSYVDDVLEFNTKDEFPVPGESGKIYVDTSTNLTYRWSGSGYVEISQSLALGETASTAYRGDRGKIAYNNANEALKLLESITQKEYVKLFQWNGGSASIWFNFNTSITQSVFKKFKAFEVRLQGTSEIICFDTLEDKGDRIYAKSGDYFLTLQYNSTGVTNGWVDFSHNDGVITLSDYDLYGVNYILDILDEETIGMAQSLGFLSGGGSEPT